MMTTTQWKLVGLAVAVAAVALIVGFVALRDGGGLETVGRNGESTTTTGAPTTEAATGELPLR